MKAIALLPLMLVASISQAAETVKIYNWSDYIAPDTTKNFQKDTGIGFTYDVYDSNETLDGKLMTGKSGYDVVFPSNHFMARQIQGGALKSSTRASCPTGKTSTRCCSRPWKTTTLAMPTASRTCGAALALATTSTRSRRYSATTPRWIPGT